MRYLCSHLLIISLSSVLAVGFSGQLIQKLPSLCPVHYNIGGYSMTRNKIP
jgi:hypothetical protein